MQTTTFRTTESRAKFENENKMAVEDRAAVVSLIEELSDKGSLKTSK